MQPQNRVVLEQREYDVYNLDALDNELSAVTCGGAVIDFANVNYVDSTALGRLVRTLKRARSENERSTIRLENLAPSIRYVFALTGLDRIFEIP